MGHEPGDVVLFPVAGREPDDNDPELVPAVEALLFAAPRPVTIADLCAALDGVPAIGVRQALAYLERRHRSAGSGLELVRVGGGVQLRTDPRFAGPVAAIRGGKPRRLSDAALEALAVVAYRQPVTRREVEALRGVDTGGVLRTLLERGLIRVSGRRDEPGRPLVYSTTRQFLETFSLPDLGALPTLADRMDPDD